MYIFLVFYFFVYFIYLLLFNNIYIYNLIIKLNTYKYKEKIEIINKIIINKINIYINKINIYINYNLYIHNHNCKMTSFNNIINIDEFANESSNNSTIDSTIDLINKSSFETNEYENVHSNSQLQETLFTFNDTIPKANLVQNEIHYLDSSKLYNQKKKVRRIYIKYASMYYIILYDWFRKNVI